MIENDYTSFSIEIVKTMTILKHMNIVEKTKIPTIYTEKNLVETFMSS